MNARLTGRVTDARPRELPAVFNGQRLRSAHQHLHAEDKKQKQNNKEKWRINEHRNGFRNLEQAQGRDIADALMLSWTLFVYQRDFIRM